MIFWTVGPTATQCGHWKSRNSMMVTGASTGPVVRRIIDRDLVPLILGRDGHGKKEDQGHKYNSSHSIPH